LDEQQYRARTTTQYEYKPAYNTTTLTVLAGSTEIVIRAMAAEEIQKKA